ncbi:hypothetical protein K501DRAFT_250975 [Backusella circina FSU 941]|nr:hypothetical protein K501DRAFT_250975 [Backusella circina FSU 941]
MTTIETYTERLVELEKASTENSSLDTVISCLSTPLAWLGYNETTPPLSATQQITLIQHSAWKRHVWHVLKNIIPTWSFSLSPHRALIDATLCFDQSNCLVLAMSKVALPTLIECISTERDAPLNVLELYAELLKRLTTSSTLFPAYIQGFKGAATYEVQYFCTLLCSVSSHLMNVFGVQSRSLESNDDEWYIDRNYYAKLTKRLAEALLELDQYPGLFPGELFGKMMKQGYEDICISTALPFIKNTKNKTIWPSLFQFVETIVSSEKINKSLLRLVKEGKELSNALFTQITEHNTLQRAQDFLYCSLLKIALSSWADQTIIRVALSTVVNIPDIDAESLKLIFSNLFKQIADRWSDLVFIQHASTRERKYITTSLLSIIGQLSTEQLNLLVSSTGLMISIARYFDSADIMTAKLGVAVAEAISGRVDGENPLDFGVLDSVTDHDLIQLKRLAIETDIKKEEEEKRKNGRGESALVENSGLETDSESEEEEDEFDPNEIIDPDNDGDNLEDDDDDLIPYEMEEESDEEQDAGPQKDKQKPPVYVRDLVKYLRDRKDPIKLDLALGVAESIIRQKAGVGTELSESSLELSRYLLGLPETYDLKDFRERQLNSMIALVVAVPSSVAGFLIDQLYDRNTSMGQKQLILSVISLSVRELAGWSNAAAEPAVQQLEDLTISNELITPSDLVGRTTFISKRMEIEKVAQQKRHKNRLAGVIGPVFFSPLLVGWWEGSQGRLKWWIGMDKLLTERFIMTLNIILRSATNTLEKPQIVKEYFELGLSMRYSNITVGVKRALLLGFDTIINICYSDQGNALFHDFHADLVTTRDWLHDIVENSSEISLHNLSLNVLASLVQLAKGRDY